MPFKRKTAGIFLVDKINEELTSKALVLYHRTGEKLREIKQEEDH